MSMNDDEIVRALRALADTTRFRMVKEIAAAEELSCGEVQECFGLAQPTISHHLKILTDAGLVIVRNEAKHHFFSVNRALLNRLGAIVPERLTSTPKRASKPKKIARAQ